MVRLSWDRWRVLDFCPGSAEARGRRGLCDTIHVDERAAGAIVRMHRGIVQIENRREANVGAFEQAAPFVTRTCGDEDRMRAFSAGHFRDFIARYVDVVTTDFAACLIRSGPDALGPQGRAEILRGRRKLEQTLEGILRKGIADGSIAPCDTKMSAFTIFGALHWLCFWYRADGPLTRTEIAQRMVALFRRGLEPRPAVRTFVPTRARKR